MSTRSIITGLLLLLAVGGIVYVLADGRKQSPQPEAVHAEASDQTGQADQSNAGNPAAAAVEPPSDGLPSDGVVVYYFHGRQRCYTCNKMESLADKVVSQQFADHLRDGWIVFQSINMQVPENSHFARDYELRSAGVVMVEREQGQNVRWRRLDEVWTKIRNDQQYKTYIAENLTECLRAVGLERI